MLYLEHFGLLFCGQFEDLFVKNWSIDLTRCSKLSVYQFGFFCLLSPWILVSSFVYVMYDSALSLLCALTAGLFATLDLQNHRFLRWLTLASCLRLLSWSYYWCCCSCLSFDLSRSDFILGIPALAPGNFQNEMWSFVYSVVSKTTVNDWFLVGDHGHHLSWYIDRAAL